MTEKEDGFTITILGSGTCVPSLDRSACSVMLETAGKTVVFDFGAGTMKQLLRIGKKMADIDMIFLSHFHPDHSAEIIPFLFAVKHYEKIKRPGGVTIVGGPGFRTFFDRLQACFGDWLCPCDDFLEIIEMTPGKTGKTDFGGFAVTGESVFHKPESLAYRITGSQGKTVVYSGDTGYCQSLIDAARFADLFICESAFPDGFDTKRHLTPSQAGAIANAAGARRLVLTHFYPECEKVDIAKQAARTYDGSLFLAEDLMEINI